MRRLIGRLTGAVLVALLFLSACTGDDDDESTAPPEADEDQPATIEDALWIGTEGGRVLRIVPTFEDPISGRLTLGQNLPVGTQRRATVALDDDGSVWAVASEMSDIVHVDADGIELHRITVDDRETADLISVSLANGIVWVADRGNDRLLAVDTEAIDIVHQIELEQRPQVVLATDEAVWVGTGPAGAPGVGSIVRIDPEAGRIVARIDLPEEIFIPEGGRPPDEGYPVSMTSSPGALWFVTYPGGTLNRIDTTTNELTASLPVGRLNVDWRPGLAAGGGQVWMTDMRNHVILRVNEGTAEIESVIPIALENEDFGTTTTEPDPLAGAGGDEATEEADEETPFDAAPGPLAYLDGAVWVGDFYSVFLYEIDPATNTHVATMNLRESPSFTTVSDAKFWTMTAD